MAYDENDCILTQTNMKMKVHLLTLNQCGLS